MALALELGDELALFDDLRVDRPVTLAQLAQLGAGGVELNVTGPVLEETISVRFAGVRGDTLADALDLHGIYVSTGSACHAKDETVSHVLSAQGLSEEDARSTVRFSLGPDVSDGDIDRVSSVTLKTIEGLRRAAGAVGARR